MGTLLDLLLLLVIGKEAFQIGKDLPPLLWAVFVVGFPFFLGMAHVMRENRSSITREPVQALIGEGLTLVTVILFVTLLAYQGLATAFWGLFLVMLVFYGMGRALGMTLKGLLLIGAVVLGILLLRLFGGIQ